MHRLFFVILLCIAYASPTLGALSLTTPLGLPASVTNGGNITSSIELISRYYFSCISTDVESGYTFRAAYIRHENRTYGVNVTSALTLIPPFTGIPGGYTTNAVTCALFHMRPPTDFPLSTYCTGIDLPATATYVIPVGLTYQVTYTCEWSETTSVASARHTASQTFDNVRPMWPHAPSFDGPSFVAPGSYVGYFNMDNAVSTQSRTFGLTLKTSDGAHTGLYALGYQFLVLFDSPGLPSVRYRVSYPYNIDTENPESVRLGTIEYARHALLGRQFARTSEPSLYPGNTYRVRIWMQSPFFVGGIRQIFDTTRDTLVRTSDPIKDKPAVLSPRSNYVASSDAEFVVASVRWWDAYDVNSTLRFVFTRITSAPVIVADVTIRLNYRFSQTIPSIKIPRHTDSFEGGTHEGFADILPGVYNISVSFWSADFGGWSPPEFVTNVTILSLPFPSQTVSNVGTLALSPVVRAVGYGRTGMSKSWFVVVELPRIYVYNLSLSTTHTASELSGGSQFYDTGLSYSLGSQVCITDDGIIVMHKSLSKISLYTIGANGNVSVIVDTPQSQSFSTVLAVAYSRLSTMPLLTSRWQTAATSHAICLNAFDTNDFYGAWCAQISGFQAVSGSAFFTSLRPIEHPALSYDQVDYITTSHVPDIMWAIGRDGFGTRLCAINVTAKASRCRIIVGTVYENPVLWPHLDGVRLLLVAPTTELSRFGVTVPCDTLDCRCNVELFVTMASLNGTGNGIVSLDYQLTRAYKSGVPFSTTILADPYSIALSLNGADPRFNDSYAVTRSSTGSVAIFRRGHILQFELAPDPGVPIDSTLTTALVYDPVARVLVQVGATSFKFGVRHRFRTFRINPAIPPIVAPIVPEAEYEVGSLPITYQFQTHNERGTIFARVVDRATNDSYVFTLPESPVSSATTLISLVAQGSAMSVQHATGGDGHSLRLLAETVNPPIIPDGNFSVFVGYTDFESGITVTALLYENVLLYTTHVPDCSGNGILTLAACTCNATFHGPICNQTLAQCSTQHCPEWYECTPTIAGNFSCIVNCPNCGTHGFCNDIHSCTCDDGWEGALCGERTCPVCGEHGTCVDGACDCDEGWAPPLCVEPVCPNCGDHGVCVAGYCNCDPGWLGDVCDEVPCPDCGAHGDCVDGLCVCTGGWTNELCDEPPCPACAEHGTCENGECVCDVGWTGDLCDEQFCPDCGPHGSCVGEVCVCVGGWTGGACHIPPCPICGENGVCVDGLCDCDAGWTGTLCDERICPDCGSHGECVDGLCDCVGGWSGPLCDEPPCPACATHGTCFNGTCVCGSGWTGALCEFPPCQLHSTRVNGSCTCDSGYFGNDCSCTESCGVHGACESATCICADGYYGAICSMSQLVCDGVVCGGGNATCARSPMDDTTIVCTPPPPPGCNCRFGGTCENATNPDACTCEVGTFGPYCNLTQAACATTHCEYDITRRTCAETVGGVMECITPVAPVDDFDEDRYTLGGAAIAGAGALVVISVLVWYFKPCGTTSGGWAHLGTGTV